MAKTLQELLRERTIQGTVDLTNLEELTAKQLEQSRNYKAGVPPEEPAVGEVTEADYTGAIGRVFTFAGALHLPAERIVKDMMQGAREYAQIQPAETASTGKPALTTQFSGAPAEPAAATPAGGESPSVTKP